MRRMAVMLAAGALALAACGGDDDDDAGGGGDVSEEEQPYVDALEASLAEGSADFPVTEDQAGCLAPRWVSAIGVDRLEAAGIEPADMESDDSDLTELGLSEEDGNELYDSFGACDVDVTEMIVDSMGEDSDLSDEDRECLADAFDDDLLRRLMVTALTQGEEALQTDEELMGDLFGVVAECPGVAG